MGHEAEDAAGHDQPAGAVEDCDSLREQLAAVTRERDMWRKQFEALAVLLRARAELQDVDARMELESMAALAERTIKFVLNSKIKQG